MESLFASCICVSKSFLNLGSFLLWVIVVFVVEVMVGVAVVAGIMFGIVQTLD